MTPEDREEIAVDPTLVLGAPDRCLDCGQADDVRFDACRGMVGGYVCTWCTPCRPRELGGSR